MKKTIALITGFILIVLFQNCSDVNVAPPPPDLPHLSAKVRLCHPAGSFLKSTFATNLSGAYTVDGDMESDTDRDGLPDIFEGQTLNVQTYGISYLRSDNNTDGYSDLMMVRAGILRESQNTLSVCLDPVRDTDGDGLTDCEEVVARTLNDNVDTDADGISDFLEYRMGLNPNDGLDADQDLDMDGISNADEIMQGTPYFQSNNSDHEYWKMSMLTEPLADNCQSVTISNIPLFPVKNGNQIRIFFLESNSLGQDKIRSVNYVTEPLPSDQAVSLDLDILDQLEVNQGVQP